MYIEERHADGREISEAWYNSGGVLVNLLNYSYDADSNMLTAGDVNGTYTFTYDALNRISTQQDMFGTTQTYTYDADSNLIKITDSLGGVETLTYDADNRQSGEEFAGNSQTMSAGFTYTADSELKSIKRFSDAAETTLVGSTSYSYDALTQVTNINHLGPTLANLTDVTYVYDAANEITSQNRDGTVVTYTYDATGQLLSDSSATYTYDANGNRNSGSFTVGSNNEISNDGTWTYTYDANGDIIEKSEGPSSTTWYYTYDDRNQMTSATERATPGGTIVLSTSYSYDVFGDLITTAATASSITTVTHDAFRITDTAPGITQNVNQDWADLNSSNALTMRYVFDQMSGTPLVRLNSTSLAWLLTNNEGSTIGLADNTGAVIKTITYDGFGNITGTTGSGNSGAILFAGYRLDATTGLYLAHWRWYNPLTGQWTTVDPIGFGAGDANLNRYTANSATNAIDPSGLEETPMITLSGRTGRKNYSASYPTNDNKTFFQKEINGVGTLLTSTNATLAVDGGKGRSVTILSAIVAGKVFSVAEVKVVQYSSYILSFNNKDGDGSTLKGTEAADSEGQKIKTGTYASPDWYIDGPEQIANPNDPNVAPNPVLKGFQASPGVTWVVDSPLIDSTFLGAGLFSLMTNGARVKRLDCYGTYQTWYFLGGKPIALVEWYTHSEYVMAAEGVPTQCNIDATEKAEVAGYGKPKLIVDQQSFTPANYPVLGGIRQNYSNFYPKGN